MRLLSMSKRWSFDVSKKGGIPMCLCIALFRNDHPCTWARTPGPENSFKKARGFRYQLKIGLAEHSVPIPIFALFDQSGGMNHYVFESDDEDDLEGGSLIELISEHTTKEEAVIALHSADMAEYHFLNNYTNTGASCVKTTLPKVDSFLKGGAGSKRCRLMLLQKYSTNPGMLLKIPNVVKLKNRKATLKKSRVATWDIKDFSVMMELSHTKMCMSPTAFFGPDGFNPATDQTTFAVADLTYQNELLILKSFDHELVGESGPAVSFGLIFTSRRLLRNIYSI
ncbi:unnamed protein product [Phytophthora fragariaefolia]|uniref:Unnamed protein product n=1 Tax=Phytophthora fragariaefolia TaxID=1490495 RepID=A0A9W6Y190_9STRA|nr:unnamed protein product [Phytophthora fragariaefolia]